MWIHAWKISSVLCHKEPAKGRAWIYLKSVCILYILETSTYLFNKNYNCPEITDYRMTTFKIVMIRHGEKLRLKDSFGSWCDRQLTPRGEDQARTAGRALVEAGYQFDVAHTSQLTRAQV